MVKENLKEDQYIYALEFMELTLLKNTKEYKCTCILSWMRPFRNIVFFCLNTIDELVQISSSTGFLRYHNNKTYTLVQFIEID